MELPTDATELRPEVYQMISRLSKSFLEPGSKPVRSLLLLISLSANYTDETIGTWIVQNTLRASATEPKALVRLERLLSNAFATVSPLLPYFPTSAHSQSTSTGFNSSLDPSLRISPNLTATPPLFSRSSSTLDPTFPPLLRRHYHFRSTRIIATERFG